MPAHLRPPERRAARPLGLLAIALGIAVLVFAGFSGRPADDGTTRLVQPATETSNESSTDPTVLGEDIERTTVPDAPPASAAGITTTTAGDAPGGQSNGTTAYGTPSPTIGPPASITRPPPPRPTTTTTAPTTTTTAPTTTTTAPTTTTVVTTTNEP